jgi:hypothetical protein
MKPSLAFLGICAVVTTAALCAGGESPQIIVDPNILVSRDGDFPHFEYMVAANPLDASNLVGASMGIPEPGGLIATMTYFSHDRGQTWKVGKFFDQDVEAEGFGSGDPQVAFGPNGTAYFAVLRGDSQLYFYRSRDGGRTWLKPVDLYTCDHEQIAVDTTASDFRGDIYLWGLHGDGLVFFRSNDDGRTFSQPVKLVHSSGVQTTQPVILLDGTLILPYIEWGASFGSTRAFKFIASFDGGLSFSPQREVAIQHVPFAKLTVDLRQRMSLNPADPNTPRLGGIFDWPVTPQLAASPDSTRRNSSLYATWADTGQGNSRLLFSSSVDGGKSWTNPALVSPDVPRNVYQYQQMMAVNNAGIVGVEWFDTRRSAHQDSYDLYFTASMDGGKTFLPARCITSQSSLPASIQHFIPYVSALSRESDSNHLQFGLPFGQRVAGGDYIGLTTDANGVFHPLWPDSRSGPMQVWTTQIRVGKIALVDAVTVKNTPRIIDPKGLQFVLDPIRYDSSTGELVLPVRVINRTSHNLYAPLTVALKSIELAQPTLGDAGFVPPQILNAANGKKDAGATFDYSAALGDRRLLEPGEVSEAVPWKLRMRDPGQGEFLIEAETSAVYGERKGSPTDGE